MLTKPKPGTKKLGLKRKFLKRRFTQFFLWALVGLSIAIGIFVGRHYFKPIQVNNFSWEDMKVGVSQQQFTLTFSHLMDHASVEANLKIQPPLAGKISWEGREMTYTLSEVPLYGNRYYVQLSEAQTAKGKQTIKPFIGEFQTRDRAFVYLGVEAAEKGRLILYNLTQQEKLLLTSPDLTVVDFEPYPQGDRILFSAVSNRHPQTRNQKLYTVTTGINSVGSKEKQPVGKLKVVLEGKQGQNLTFDLADRGQTIIVQQQEPTTENGELWVIPEDGTPQSLEVQASQFVVSPNGQTFALAQPEGVALIPLTPKAESSFLFPEYDRVLTFSPNSQATIMVKNQPDGMQSLFLVNAKKERELLTTAGKVLDCDFEPKQQKTLYCLNTEVMEAVDGTVVEKPYLEAINIETTARVSLLSLPNYPDVQMSIAPDGIAVLFDQIVATLPKPNSKLQTENGNAIMMSKLWLLPLPEIPTTANPNRVSPEELIPGFRPRWLS
jgi:hypothetical protein